MQTFRDHVPVHHRLALVLRACRPIRFCDDCLASRMGARPRDVRDAVLRLGRRSGFQAKPGVCADCLRARARVYVRAAWSGPLAAAGPGPTP